MCFTYVGKRASAGAEHSREMFSEQPECACRCWQKSSQASSGWTLGPVKNQAPFAYSLALTCKFQVPGWSLKVPARLASNLWLSSQQLFR